MCELLYKRTNIDITADSQCKLLQASTVKHILEHTHTYTTDRVMYGQHTGLTTKIDLVLGEYSGMGIFFLKIGMPLMAPLVETVFFLQCLYGRLCRVKKLPSIVWINFWIHFAIILLNSSKNIRFRKFCHTVDFGSNVFFCHKVYVRHIVRRDLTFLECQYVYNAHWDYLCFLVNKIIFNVSNGRNLWKN